MRVLLLLALLSPALASPGGYVDYNGLRYMLADPSIDVVNVDFAGDDCASLPCASFVLPVGCNVSTSSSVALMLPWSTSFLATTTGISPVVDWMPVPDVGSLVSVTSGSVSLIDFGYQARILLQCLMPCPDGSVLNGTVCSACPTGRWASGGVCVSCSNKPFGSVYVSNGIGSSNCSYSCSAGLFPRSIPSPSLLIGDQGTVRLIASDSTVATLYRPLVSDATYGFMFMVNASNQTVYLGSYSVNLLNLTSGSYSNVAGGSVRGVVDGVGTAARFNNIVGAFFWQGYLMALDGSNCNLRRVDLLIRSVVTVAGSGCSFQDGVGMAARFLYPMDVVVDAAGGLAYVAESLRIRKIVLSSFSVSTIVGNGVGGNLDGVGIAATIDPRFMALSSDGLFLYVKTIVSIRQIDLSTMRVTTLITFSVAGPFQMVYAGQGVLYFATGFEVAALVVASGQVITVAGGSSAGVVDGVGSSARFTSPVLMSIVDNSASRLVCMACPVCSAGSYAICNASTSLCAVCPLGKYSVTGVAQCTSCGTGTYGVAGGACAVCGIGSYSVAGSTTCTNCSAGMYLANGACVGCLKGTYAVSGSTVCSTCTNLIGNSTFSGAGTNATNCAIACLVGFTYSADNNLCSLCSVGQWSAAGSTLCSTCVAAPSNASYIGVGVNATSCPFVCGIGYTSNGTACVPCTPGTRMVAGVCTPCLAGSYSGLAASACSPCASGSYSVAGGSTCLMCANQGAYTQFVGRGISLNCPFICRAGAFVFNRTTCVACTNGTFSSLGSTACTNCPSGMWSGSGSSMCAGCTSLVITAAVGGVGLPEYGFVSKAGWAVQSVVCV